MLSSTIESIKTYLSRMADIRVNDVIEIIIIAFLIYHILIWIKDSRAWTLLKGVLLIAFFVFLAYIFEMNTILWIVQNVLSWAVIAIVVVLQPELRRAIEELGNKNIISSIVPFADMSKGIVDGRFSDKTINEIARACVEMGKVKTGALIVIEQTESLSEYERTGIEVDGVVTSQLLINIFEKNTPLHDGAVIVRGNRVTSATCYLPLSDNMMLSKDLGTRHRAAVGISEATDSMTVIVSEETGRISVAYQGKLTRNLDQEGLKQQLRTVQNKATDEDVPKKKIFFKKGRVKDER